MVFDRLNELNDRYIELEQRMEQPEVYTDAEAYSRCARELRELEPVITAFRSYQEAVAAMDDARSLMDDPEMRELAQDELEDAMSRRDQLEHELQLLHLVIRDDGDGASPIRIRFARLVDHEVANERKVDNLLTLLFGTVDKDYLGDDHHLYLLVLTILPMVDFLLGSSISLIAQP